MTITVEGNPVLSAELIKGLIAVASGRKVGMAIRLSDICGRSTDSWYTLKDIQPCLVSVKDDGRVGFCVGDASFIPDSPASGERFATWLHAANEKAPSGEDYGQPGKECKFKRCS